jgi:NADPH-dependent 2,4-dienoyl-CoA reductase/sulfur reductase-like enzyme
MHERLIIIGGTAAGLSAASRAKKSRPDLEVKVFEKSGYASYGSCGLPYFVGGMIESETELISLTPEQLRKDRGIETSLHHEVTKIDKEAQTVDVVNLETGASSSLHYDYLVIATGASPVLPEIPNIHAKGVFSLRTIEDGLAIRKRVRESAQKRAVIVGCGFIGLELAEQLCLNGFKVTIFEALPRILPFLDPSYSALVMSTLAKNGVEVRTGAALAGIGTENGEVAGVTASDGYSCGTDLVIVSVGVAPNTQLARSAGLKLGVKGGIVVDDRQKTSDKAIWACGDCVQMYNCISGRETYVPMGTTANKQGRVAGGNIVGDPSTFKGVLGSMVTKVFDLYIAATGLTAEQASAAGFEAESAAIVKSDKASYYPGRADNHIRLVFDRCSGRVLGAQALGSESVAGRMNAIAVAISAGMTIEVLNEIDFVYAPPVAPVYDPLLIAASQALKKMNTVSNAALGMMKQ